MPPARPLPLRLAGIVAAAGALVLPAAATAEAWPEAPDEPAPGWWEEAPPDADPGWAGEDPEEAPPDEDPWGAEPEPEPEAEAPSPRRPAPVPGPRVRPGTVAYPLAVRGVRIGSPRTGTHRLGNWQSDRAIDIAVPVGTPVRATEDGVIGGPMGRSRSRDPRFAGLRLTLEGRRDTWFYAHLRSIRVRPGQAVRRGEVIGRSGAANGVAHLHIAARRANPLVVFG